MVRPAAPGGSARLLPRVCHAGRGVVRRVPGRAAATTGRAGHPTASTGGSRPSPTRTPCGIWWPGAKYRGARTGWSWLAEALAEVVAEAGGAPSLQVVTWPPTTLARRRERGFDQAEWLARRVAAHLSLPAAGLLRRRPGPAQTGRDRRARAEHGPVFIARPGAQGKRLLVVDDVATTGATVASAAPGPSPGGSGDGGGGDHGPDAAARRPAQNYQGPLKAPPRRAPIFEWSPNLWATQEPDDSHGTALRDVGVRRPGTHGACRRPRRPGASGRGAPAAPAGGVGLLRPSGRGAR